MLKRGKKSTISLSASLFWLFGLVLVAITWFTLSSQAEALEGDVTFEETYLSKDIALIVDVISAAPGNINYIYTHEKIELEKFDYTFENNEIAVDWNGVKKKYSHSSKKSEQTLDEIIQNPEQIVFSKKGNSISVQNG